VPIKRTTVTIALVLAATQAHASAGLSCRAEDQSVRLGLDAAFTRGLGGGLVNFGASLDILVSDAPNDLRTFQFDRSEVSQVWWYRRDIKVELHRERAANGLGGSVDLIIETVQNTDDESVYRGGYELRIEYQQAESDREWKSLEARGEVVCSTE
jgi:hypothetical protein